MYSLILLCEYKIVPIQTMKHYVGFRIQTDELEPRQWMPESTNVEHWLGEWVGQRAWSINTGGQNSWVTVFQRPGQKRGVAANRRKALFCDIGSACTNVAVLFLCNTVYASINVTVLFCVVLWMPVPM